MKITTTLYIKSIREAIEKEGWKVADIMNKYALECRAITIDQYSKAARLISKAYLDSDPV